MNRGVVVWASDVPTPQMPVRCLEDELVGPLKVDGRLRKERTPRVCTHCGEGTKSPKRECGRIACVALRTLP